MKIEVFTKHNIGETVYFLNSCTTKIVKSTIKSVNILATEDSTKVFYTTASANCIAEHEAYTSKEELLTALSSTLEE